MADFRGVDPIFGTLADFDRLVDPYGIAFWPDFKGRDGCRTPMPWTGEAPWGGFSRVEPRLPMPAEHLALAVAGQQDDPDSVLAFVRAFLAWRRRRSRPGACSCRPGGASSVSRSPDHGQPASQGTAQSLRRHPHPARGGSGDPGRTPPCGCRC